MERNYDQITESIKSECFTNSQGEKVIEITINDRALDETFYPEDSKEQHLESLEFSGITGEKAELIANKLIELYS